MCEKALTFKGGHRVVPPGRRDLLAIEQERRAVDERPAEVLNAEGAGILHLVAGASSRRRSGASDRRRASDNVRRSSPSARRCVGRSARPGPRRRPPAAWAGLSGFVAIGHAEAELAEQVLAVGVLLRDRDRQTCAAVVASVVLCLRTWPRGSCRTAARRPSRSGRCRRSPPAGAKLSWLKSAEAFSSASGCVCDGSLLAAIADFQLADDEIAVEQRGPDLCRAAKRSASASSLKPGDVLQIGSGATIV